MSVIVYVERAGLPPLPALPPKKKRNQHTRNKAVCFAKCYEFRVRKMNKTYHRARSRRTRRYSANIRQRWKMYDERASKSHIDFAGDIHVSRARKPGDKFFLLETLICDIYVLSCEHRAKIYSSLGPRDGNLGTLFNETFPIYLSYSPPPPPLRSCIELSRIERDRRLTESHDLCP